MNLLICIVAFIIVVFIYFLFWVLAAISKRSNQRCGIDE
jgi:hypothetical protein